MNVSHSGILDNQIIGKPTRDLTVKLFICAWYCLRILTKSCNHYSLETKRQTRHNIPIYIFLSIRLNNPEASRNCLRDFLILVLEQA